MCVAFRIDAHADERSQFTSSPALALALRPPAPQWPTGGGVGGGVAANGSLSVGAASVFANHSVAHTVTASHEAVQVSEDGASDNERHDDRQPLKRAPSPILRPDATAKVHKGDEWHAAAAPLDEGGDDDDDDGDDGDDDGAMVQIVNEASSE